MGSEKPYRILVVEDDEGFLDAVERVLSTDGRFVVAGRARDGEEALDLAATLPIDAVVMDIEMPVLDGVEATRRLVATTPGLPVVAISGHDYEERVFEIQEAGATDYVRKARVPDDLCAALAAALRAPATRR